VEFLIKNQKFFESIMGLDVDIQIEPKFRISRPGKPQDNIGYHYDLDYGNSPYEISCMFNLTDADEEGAVRLLTGSHAQPKLKTHPVVSIGVEKGSIKHQLGTPYLLQRVVDESYKSKMVPIPFKVGEVVCFDLGLLHGLEVSNSKTTRFSIDCRLKSPFTNSGVRQGYYKSLFRSPLAKAASRFYEANPVAQEEDRSSE
jgi:ectoine hydroxylase-related dioxygenase (phytanoyl-CoA dioxygenase family)